MNTSAQPMLASSSQPSKLPIPRLPSLQTSSTWSSPTSTNSITPNAQQIDNNTAQQQTTKKTQNKRGRKPLSSMPTTKKHIQNLTNQRAFRQRRETYIRSLEIKATRFETLLKDARNEIESLKGRVASLEKQVDIEERINICDGVETTTTDESIRINNIVHNDNINSFNNNNKIETSCCGSQSNRCFTPFTTTNTSSITPSFSFNDQHQLINQQISCDIPMLPPLEDVGDVIRDPLFCETKEGDLCFCEPGENSIDEVTTTTTTEIDKCLTGDKLVAKKQVWILSKQITTPPTTISSPLYSNYATDDYSSPHNWHQQDYFSPAVSSAVVTTTTNQFYPLHLKWILGDANDT